MEGHALGLDLAHRAQGKEAKSLPIDEYDVQPTVTLDVLDKSALADRRPQLARAYQAGRRGEVTLGAPAALADGGLQLPLADGKGSIVGALRRRLLEAGDGLAQHGEQRYESPVVRAG